MTREEELKKAAEKYQYNSDGSVPKAIAFIAGAEWADKNPTENNKDLRYWLKEIYEYCDSYRTKDTEHLNHILKLTCFALGIEFDG